MIIQQQSGLVQSCGVISQVACSIDVKDMPYVAHLLRKNYSDQRWATVREIIANAVDANDEATDIDHIYRNVVVDLPSDLQPEFVVRDFGKGLTPEKIIGYTDDKGDFVAGLYSYYGKSTKRNSNRTIGGYGIGRFAPLSYTGSFMVESFCNGTVSVYCVYIDSDDNVKISLMNSESTTEPNGIKIVVAVDPVDVKVFRDHILKLDFYGDFNLANPKGKLLRDVYAEEYPVKETVFAGKGWKAVKSDTLGNVITMGGIPYPINRSQLNLTGKVASFLSYFWYGSGYNHYTRANTKKFSWIIEEDVGAVSLHHSREALEYDKDTIKFVEDKINAIYEEFKLQILGKLDSATDYANACAIFGEIIEEVGYDSFVNCFDFPNYNGKQLIYQYHFPYRHTCYEYTPDSDTASGFSRAKIAKGASRSMSCKTAFLMRDTDDQIIPRVRYLYDDKGFDTVFVIHKDDIDVINRKCQLDEFSDYRFYISTCPEKIVKRQVGKRRKNPPYSLKSMNPNDYWWRISNLKDISSETLDKNKTFYYIPIYRNSFMDDKYETNQYINQKEIAAMMKFVGLKADFIYLVPKSSESKRRNDKERTWVNFFAAIGEKLESLYGNDKLITYGNSPFYSESEYLKSDFYSIYKRRGELADTDLVKKLEEIHAHFNAWAKMDKSSTSVNAINNYCGKVYGFIKKKIKVDLAEHSLQQFFDEFDKKYFPILKTLNGNSGICQRKYGGSKVIDLLIFLLNEKRG